jgi:RNA polymerase sigma-70 factor, ECF subfamily
MTRWARNAYRMTNACREFHMWNSEKTPRGATCGLSFEGLQSLSDEDLFYHLGHEDADAVALLYQRYRRLVFAVAFQVLRDHGEAEDVVQNVFVDLYKTNLRYDPARGTVKIWILQFAYHRSFRQKRRLKSCQFYTTVELSEIQDSIPTDSSLVADVENRQLIAKACEALGDSQKQVIEMACYEGLSLRDIAEATGKKLANVRHHYYRGLQTLRAYLRIRKEREVPRRQKEASDATA